MGVAVVGAGPTGLALGVFLRRLGVDVTILERRMTRVPQHPQAHFINNRTMEVLRTVPGLAQKVAEYASPLEEWRRFVYAESVAGKAFGVVDHFPSGRERDPATSPEGVVHLSQPQLCALLADEFEQPQTAGKKQGEGELILGAEVTAVKQVGENFPGGTKGKMIVEYIRKGEGEGEGEGEECFATYAGLPTQSVRKEASHLVAADGAHSRVRHLLGIPMQGTTNLQSLINVHFISVDLAHLVRERPGMLYFVFNPSVVLVLVVHCLERAEFVAQIPFFPEAETVEESFTVSKCAAMLKEAAGRDIELTVESVRPWRMSSVIAREFQRGRTFLAGDAAHCFPPAGGFGMNTGIQDAHNLAWKLAATLKGEAPASLLASYHRERRPVAVANAALSVRNYEETLRVSARLGLSAGMAAGVAKTVKALQPFFGRERGESLFTAAKRLGLMPLSALNPLRRLSHLSVSQLFKEAKTLRLQFPVADLGFRYPPTTPVHGSDPRGEKFRPRAEVGARLPHFRIAVAAQEVEEEEFKFTSSLDLVQPGLGRGRGVGMKTTALLILSSSDTPQGVAAYGAAARLATLGKNVQGLLLSSSSQREGDNNNNDGDTASSCSPVVIAEDWLSVCGLPSTGVLIVRPDGHLGAKLEAEEETERFAKLLETACEEILAHGFYKPSS